MAWHNRLGIRGEKIAAAYLRKKGYAIEAQNWRFGRTEVDLIARKDGLLVFVEVKTRCNPQFGWPEQAVSERKQRLLQEAAEEYLRQHGLQEAARFDVIAIVMKDGKARVRHFRDAFCASDDLL